MKKYKPLFQQIHEANLLLTRKQNDIDELVEFLKEVKYLTSNEMLYSKSIELIQKHTNIK